MKKYRLTSMKMNFTTDIPIFLGSMLKCILESLKNTTKGLCLMFQVEIASGIIPL